MECCGDLCVCRKRQVGEKSEVVDRKLNLVVRELQRYGVAVAGLECRRAWFGADVWPAVDEGFTFLLYQAVLMWLLGMRELGFCWMLLDART